MCECFPSPTKCERDAVWREWNVIMERHSEQQLIITSNWSWFACHHPRSPALPLPFVECCKLNALRKRKKRRSIPLEEDSYHPENVAINHVPFYLEHVLFSLRFCLGLSVCLAQEMDWTRILRLVTFNQKVGKEGHSIDKLKGHFIWIPLVLPIFLIAQINYLISEIHKFLKYLNRNNNSIPLAILPTLLP